MLLAQLARIDQDELNEIAERLAARKDTPQRLASLLPLIARLPFYCGREDCHNEGCSSIRAMRHEVDEILANIRV